ncbi:MAG TPA: hypothetical protein VN969_10280 [Streptosporangiaceae bacterium]|nr:hypothetical protein [Streptosporangiaceae bacterium]
MRTGPAAGIFPMVYQDLARWTEAHGYTTSPPGQQVFEIQPNDQNDIAFTCD